MKKRVILGTLVAATLLMTACGNSEATTKSESKGGSNALVVSTLKILSKKTLSLRLKKKMKRKLP